MEPMPASGALLCTAAASSGLQAAAGRAPSRARGILQNEYQTQPPPPTTSFPSLSLGTRLDSIPARLFTLCLFFWAPCSSHLHIHHQWCARHRVPPSLGLPQQLHLLAFTLDALNVFHRFHDLFFFFSFSSFFNWDIIMSSSTPSTPTGAPSTSPSPSSAGGTDPSSSSSPPFLSSSSPSSSVSSGSESSSYSLYSLSPLLCLPLTCCSFLIIQVLPLP